MIEITSEIATKIRDTINLGLSNGLGRPIPGEMCIEAVICHCLQLPHGDDPGCVMQPLRRLKISINDRDWSSPQARAKGLLRLGLAQLGSLGMDEMEFAKRVTVMVIRTFVSKTLRFAAEIHPKSANKSAMIDAARRCEQLTDYTAAAANAANAATAAANAAYAAYAAAYAARTANAAYAAYTAAKAARTADSAYTAAKAAKAAKAANSAYAAYAAAKAANAAAYTADGAYAAYAAYAAANAATTTAANAAANAYTAEDVAAANAATNDEILSEFAENVVQILIAMKAPGCQWLYLAPLS